MANQTAPCPICALVAQEILGDQDYGDKVTYKCTRCGQFTISGTAEAVASRLESRQQLSAWVRERNELGVKIPVLTSDFLGEVSKGLPKFSPVEKQRRLLQAIERRTTHPGKQIVLIPEFDYPLAWAENEEEFEFYITAAIDRGLLQKGNSKYRTLDAPAYPMVITAAGWEYLEEHEPRNVDSKQAFIAMSFDPAMRSVFEKAIAPAVSACGFSPYRVDARPHLDRIDAKIVAEIRNSRFVVADVTQQKAGVYYEAGFANGLGIPVIWCVQEDDLKNVHFDTRQYNHILWSTDDELREKLEDFIRATIGEM